MDNLIFILNAVVLLYIWFETDGVVEWARALRLKFTKFDEFFEEQRKSRVTLTYPDFLLAKYNSFWIRLITCPVCLGVWVNIVGMVIFYKWVGGVEMVGVNVMGTWVVFHYLKKLVRSTYE
jgi:hypothetical protein